MKLEIVILNFFKRLSKIEVERRLPKELAFLSTSFISDGQ